MRPHGRAQTSPMAPRAHGICQRCGFEYNLEDLAWQYDWQQGPKLFNLRFKVCASCLDIPQESGRTIVLPPDPIPVTYPLPEIYALADNPISGVGFDPLTLETAQGSSLGATFGTLAAGFGADSVFWQNGVSPAFSSTSVTALFAPQTAPLVNKRFGACANRAVSISSFQNTIGKNWNAFPSGATIATPSTVAALTHVVSGFAAYSPNDQPFLKTGATGFLFQGSPNGATWTTLSSGQTAGIAGETLAVTVAQGAAYQYHQFVLQGDGVSSVGVAGLSIAISDAAPNDI
jgi:hypothetical protein